MSDAVTEVSAVEERGIRALDAAIECFGLGGRAAGWLMTPNAILDWDVPWAVVKASEEECQLVCDVLRVMRGLGKRPHR